MVSYGGSAFTLGFYFTIIKEKNVVENMVKDIFL